MFSRRTRPVFSSIVLILAMFACNMPSASTKATQVPTFPPPIDATKIALEIQATNNVHPATQGVDPTKLALEIQATNNAPKPVDATKVALEVQATDAAAQLTQQASQPTIDLPSQPSVGAPTAASGSPTMSNQDFKTRMKTAKILVYEDTTNIGYWISDALDTMGLKYTFVGDASGTFMEYLNSPIDWDLIIVGAEARSRVQGEFWDVINERVSRDNAGLIAEVWYLNRLGEGRIKPLLTNCGVQYQKDWVKMESVYWLDSTDPLFSNPNKAMPLINYVNYWGNFFPIDHGDLLKLAPGSDAQLLAGTFQKRKSDYGVLASCLSGRVLLQTFCNHDFNHDNIIRLWQNYITYVLKNRFALKP